MKRNVSLDRRGLRAASCSLLVAAAIPLATGGCAPAGTGEVQLGVSVAPITTTDAATTDARTQAGLSITRVRLLVNTAKIGYAGGHGGKGGRGCPPGAMSSSSSSGSSGGMSSGDTTAVGPFVVDLTSAEIAIGAQRSFSLGELASGTYGGAEIEIDVLDANADTSSDASLADFASTKASVLVDGTYNGTTFQFAGHFLAEQGTDGQVTISSSSPFRLAMTVDPSKWFLDDAGAVLDPTDATKHAAIAAGICKSLDTEPALGGNPGPKAHCVEVVP